MAVSDDDGVTVPETECPFPAEQMVYLQNAINPLEECDDYGLHLYIETRDFVNSYLQANNL